ncbi:hypothetical protein BDR26DRAFT_867230 [Obelidium mucronatum]|nr:hypothetical protein BDR26DRAFT_867230 [Obelidium mucronatum]
MSTIAPQPNASSTSSLPPEFEDMFKCYICFEQLDRPVMCPTCSKIGCEDCVSKWLETNNHHCPHCRSHLTSDTLVVCRFMNDLAKQVREVVSANLRSGSTGNIANSAAEQCKEHGAPLYYFCHSCQDAICSDCAVLANKHKDHALEHLQTVYSHSRNTLYQSLKPLFLHLQKLSETKTQIESQISSLHSIKLKTMHKHERMIQKANEFLDVQFDAKCSVLGEFEGRVNAEVTRVKDLVEGVQRELRMGSRMDVIKRGRSVLQGKEATQDVDNATGSLDLSTEIASSSAGIWGPPLVQKSFVSSLIPPYESSVMKIDGFWARVLANRTKPCPSPIPSLSAAPNSGVNNAALDLDVVYSSIFRASGIDWRLKVYCNGNKGLHLSVFMQMIDGVPDVASTYQYVIELIRQTQPTETEPNGVKSVREFVSEFSTGECWGYTKFYPLDLMLTSGFVNLEDNGSLEIKFSIRAMDFAQRCRDLQWRLVKLEQPPDPAPTNDSVVAPRLLKAPRDSENLLRHRLGTGKGNDGSYSRVQPFPSSDTRPSTSPTLHSHQTLASAAEGALFDPPSPSDGLLETRPRSLSSQPSGAPSTINPRPSSTTQILSSNAPQNILTRPHTADSRRRNQFHSHQPVSSQSASVSPRAQQYRTQSFETRYIAANYAQPQHTRTIEGSRSVPIEQLPTFQRPNYQEESNTRNRASRGSRLLLPPIEVDEIRQRGRKDGRRRNQSGQYGRISETAEQNRAIARRRERSDGSDSSSCSGTTSPGGGQHAGQSNQEPVQRTWIEREAVEEVSASEEVDENIASRPVDSTDAISNDEIGARRRNRTSRGGDGSRRGGSRHQSHWESSNDEFLEVAIHEATRRIQEQLDQVAQAGGGHREDSISTLSDDESNESWHDGVVYESGASDFDGSSRERQPLQVTNTIEESRVADETDSDGDEVVRETLNRFIERLASVTARDFGSSASSSSSSLSSSGSNVLSHNRGNGVPSVGRNISGAYSSEDVDYEDMVERIERRSRLAAMLNHSPDDSFTN